MVSEKKTIIKVDGLHKSFKIPHEKSTSLKQVAVSSLRKKTFTEFHVLRGISFDIYEGEFFGIIGRNGSGKSTLLKILAGIYTYDAGTLDIRGKLSPFLELGVGFNPELTGYENVYLNGSILGLSRKEIRDKMDEIIEFSELRDFMDQKLKNYSSGMQVRLAFSVAIHAHAPIVLLDEVLAVGDSNFQQKCFKIFYDLKKAGKTIVFVSHSMESIQRFCDRAMLIHKGEIKCIGAPQDVAFEYEKLNAPSFARERLEKGKKSPIELISAQLIKGGKPVDSVKSGSDVEVKIKYLSTLAEDLLIDVVFQLYRDEFLCFGTSSNQMGNKIVAKKESSSEVTFSMKDLPLLTGEYRVSLEIRGAEGGYAYYLNPKALYFNVADRSQDKGVCKINYEWTSKK
jgi:ABC-2 type transport system ATP-binding protein